MTLINPPTTAHDTARAIAALGWHVTPPIPPGHKHPKGWNRWQDLATDDADTINNWYDTRPDHGLGITTGPATGVWVLDIDMHGDIDGYAALGDLVALHGDVTETVSAATGTDGAHLYFQWDPARPINNGHATQLPDGLDIRGAGGFVVAPPTIHPNGRPYEWVRDPWNHDPATAPEWLYELLLAEPEPAPRPTPTPLRLNGNHDQGETPAERITAEMDWHAQLQADGWAIHSTKADQTWWTRPGKNPRDGHSAVLHGTDGPLVVFTTGLANMGDWAAAGSYTTDGSGISVSKFGYIAATQHGGDRSEAARATRAEMAPATVDIQIGSTSALPVAPPGVIEAPTVKGFTDLTDWWDGTHEAKAADVLTRTDGAAILYIDQLNWLHGDSGSGKTWVLLHAIAQLLLDGVHVAWVHYEDPNPAAITARLKLLGVPRAVALEHFHYYDPQGDTLNAQHIIQLCTEHSIKFVALDSIGEALNAAGVNEDQDAEVGPWITNGPREIVNAGIGFAGVDHGTKDGNNKLHPSGSKRKRAALTGAGVLVEPITAPTVNHDGDMRLTCAKDRHGNHAQGTVIGIARLRHNVLTGGIDFSVDPPGQADGDAEAHAAASMYRAVVRVVGENPDVNKNQLLLLLPSGSKKKKFAAIDAAIEAGDVTVRFGPNRAQFFSVPAAPIDQGEF